MEILEFTLDQLTCKFRQEFGKGLFHASALSREIFKFGNRNFFDANEFTTSPVFAKQLKNKIKLTPGKVIETFKENNLTKFITLLSDGERIESVIIPMTNHQTLCVSSQVGCKMGCRFCETGRMGFKRNLQVAEITGQLFNARFTLKENIKNIVFMGMGEPLDNLNHVVQAIRVMNEQRGFDIALRHITLSTAGLIGGIEKLGSLNMSGLRLAVSINAPDDKIRSWLMPVNKTAPLQRLKRALEMFPLPKRGCFLFEYILIKGLNDSPKDAIHLSEYIKPLPVRLNLIPCNPVNGFNYESPCDDDMNRFADVLTDKGIFVIKRWSKGRSVAAGCGQLGRKC
ncbi:MAG: 23S rRNA (adenine(2503)-C(2))-methyltransferase RlmN [Desulfobacula sp.]|nr:23S rRNA (adenine(2503)-C(2))-methyltransferase RlmN [Desulfobacula sp.]